MITAISAIANDGILMKPMIVDKITNADTGAVTTVEPTQVRQVLSKETASTMKDLMKSVVVDGTGYRGAVTGYSVGGKLVLLNLQMEKKVKVMLHHLLQYHL